MYRLIPAFVKFSRFLYKVKSETLSSNMSVRTYVGLDLTKLENVFNIRGYCRCFYIFAIKIGRHGLVKSRVPQRDIGIVV